MDARQSTGFAHTGVGELTTKRSHRGMDLADESQETRPDLAQLLLVAAVRSIEDAAPNLFAPPSICWNSAARNAESCPPFVCEH